MRCLLSHDHLELLRAQLRVLIAQRPVLRALKSLLLLRTFSSLSLSLSDSLSLSLSLKLYLVIKSPFLRQGVRIGGLLNLASQPLPRRGVCPSLLTLTPRRSSRLISSSQPFYFAISATCE